MNLMLINIAEAPILYGIRHNQNQPTSHYLYLPQQLATLCKQNSPMSKSQKEGESEKEMKLGGSKSAKSEQEIVVKAIAPTKATVVEKKHHRDHFASRATIADKGAIVESQKLRERNYLIVTGDYKILKSKDNSFQTQSDALNQKEAGFETTTNPSNGQKQYLTFLEIPKYAKICI